MASHVQLAWPVAVSTLYTRQERTCTVHVDSRETDNQMMEYILHDDTSGTQHPNTFLSCLHKVLTPSYLIKCSHL